MDTVNTMVDDFGVDRWTVQDVGRHSFVVERYLHEVFFRYKLMKLKCRIQTSELPLTE